MGQVDGRDLRALRQSCHPAAISNRICSVCELNLGRLVHRRPQAVYDNTWLPLLLNQSVLRWPVWSLSLQSLDKASSSLSTVEEATPDGGECRFPTFVIPSCATTKRSPMGARGLPYSVT